MTDRDRLIELIDNFCQKELGSKFNEDILDKFSDYLLANGVIVPPCKVGDTVYYFNILWHIGLIKDHIYTAKVVRIVTTNLGTSLVIQIRNDKGCWDIPHCDFGKNLFLTKEEAEEKLKELQNAK